MSSTLPLSSKLKKPVSTSSSHLRLLIILSLIACVSTASSASSGRSKADRSLRSRESHQTVSLPDHSNLQIIVMAALVSVLLAGVLLPSSTEQVSTTRTDTASVEPTSITAGQGSTPIPTLHSNVTVADATSPPVCEPCTLCDFRNCNRPVEFNCEFPSMVGDGGPRSSCTKGVCGLARHRCCSFHSPGVTTCDWTH